MTTTVSNGHVIALEYTLKLDNNQVIETNVGKAPLTYTQGAHQIIRGIETAVAGMTLGEAKQVIVSPADGYGIRDLTALYELPKQKVPGDITVGMRLRGTDPSGRVVQPIVKEIKEHTVLLDFNHPLAGKTLFCELKVVDVHKEGNLEG